MANGPVVSFLVLRSRGRDVLAPVFGDSWQQIVSEARVLVAERPEPTEECVLVTHEPDERGDPAAVVAVASSVGHGSGVVFRQARGGLPEYVGHMPPVLPGWQGPLLESVGLPLVSSGDRYHAMIFLPPRSDVALDAVATLLARSHGRLETVHAAKQALLTHLFGFHGPASTPTLSGERARLVLRLGSWSLQVGVVRSTKPREHSLAYSRLVADDSTSQRIAGAGPLRVEIWTDPDPGGRCKHEFTAVVQVLGEELDAPHLCWLPPQDE